MVANRVTRPASKTGQGEALTSCNFSGSLRLLNSHSRQMPTASGIL